MQLSQLMFHAVGDVRHLAENTTKFLNMESFEDLWTLNAVPVKTVFEYLYDFPFEASATDASAGDQQNTVQNAAAANTLNIEGAVPTLAPEKIRSLVTKVLTYKQPELPTETREELLEMTNFLDSVLADLIADIKQIHEPMFLHLFNIALSFVKHLTSFSKVNYQNNVEIGRDSPIGEYSVISDKILTFQGKQGAEKYYACSQIFHESLREGMREIKNVAMTQYEESAHKINNGLENLAFTMSAQRSALNNLRVEIMNQTGEYQPAKVRSIQQILFDSWMLIVKATDYFVTEGSKVIRGSFELVEFSIESLCNVLTQILQFSDQNGFAEEEENNSPRGKNQSLSAVQLIEQYIDATQIVRDLYNGVVFPECGYKSNFSFDAVINKGELAYGFAQLLGQWYEQVAGYLYPLSFEIDPALLPERPKCPPQLEVSSNLLERVMLDLDDMVLGMSHHVRLRISYKKGVPVMGYITLVKDMVLLEGKTIGVQFSLSIPYKSIVDVKQSTNFIGQQNGLKLTTTLNTIELFFPDSQSREVFFTTITTKKDSARLAWNSQLAKELSFKKEVFIGRADGAIDKDTIPWDLLGQCMARNVRGMKFINLHAVHELSQEEPVFISDAILADVLETWLSSGGTSELDVGFLNEWKSKNNIQNINLLIDYSGNPFLTLPPPKQWHIPSVDLLSSSTIYDLNSSIVETSLGHVTTSRFTPTEIFLIEYLRSPLVMAISSTFVVFPSIPSSESIQIIYLSPDQVVIYSPDYCFWIARQEEKGVRLIRVNGEGRFRRDWAVTLKEKMLQLKKKGVFKPDRPKKVMILHRVIGESPSQSAINKIVGPDDTTLSDNILNNSRGDLSKPKTKPQIWDKNPYDQGDDITKNLSAPMQVATSEVTPAVNSKSQPSKTESPNSKEEKSKSSIESPKDKDEKNKSKSPKVVEQKVEEQPEVFEAQTSGNDVEAEAEKEPTETIYVEDPEANDKDKPEVNHEPGDKENYD